MTTVDIEMQDPRGGKLVICGHNLERDGYVSAQTSGPLGSINLAADGAETLIQWLRETFKLQQDLEVYYSDVLRIVVPGAVDGVPREVSWSGEGEPPAWFAGLAEIALTGQLQHRESAAALLAVRQVLAGVGINVDGAHVVDGVRDLAKAPANRASEVLVSRVNYLHGELDAHKRALAGAIEQRDVAERELAATREQRDVLESQLVTAREGLEYARSQFFSPEEEITGANWTDVVSRTIVERLDKSLAESAPQA